LYNGVYVNSVEYIRSNKADLWVVQKHATNILRNTSLLPSSYETDLNCTDGVDTASPLFFILASMKLKDTNASVFLAGFDPTSGIGKPPVLVEGRCLRTDDEIVLDKSFAKKYDIQVGDEVVINEEKLRVCGLSDGTNMFVIQYAFISLNKAHDVVGFKYVVTCYQVKVQKGQSLDAVKSAIVTKLPKVAVFDNTTFIANNVREMQSGIIPLLFFVTLISAVVLTAILSLILSINVLEKRKDFAIMKAIGCQHAFISGILVKQALLLSMSGLLLGLVMYFPMIAVLENIAPEIDTQTSILQLLSISGGVLAISLIGSIFPIRKLKQIYPLEVFM
jgi:putative ABC transport system permease protein